MKKMLAVLVLFSACVCSAQVVHHLQGEVVPSSGIDRGVLWVQLEIPGLGGTTQKVVVESDGRFAFDDVPLGIYLLRIMDGAGDEITSEPLNVSPGNTPISVRLPEQKMERPLVGSVSVERVRHQPPKRARRAFLEAQRLSEAGAHERAAAALEKAVTLDSEFIEAHGNLGVQYARLKRYDRAAEEFRLAIAQDPATAQHQSNLALVLLNLGQPAEAEQWARHAVKLDGGSAEAHYVLGCVLLMGAETRLKGIDELQVAARDFPKAHWTLAEVYRASGKKELARAEMQRYLAADPHANKPEVEQWISSLR